MKPLPEPTPLTRPFWDGCRRGELRLQRCAGCGDFRFYPAEACHACGSGECTWEAVLGEGRVYSWIVVHRPVDEFWADITSADFALGQLDELDVWLIQHSEAPPR